MRKVAQYWWTASGGWMVVQPLLGRKTGFMAQHDKQPNAKETPQLTLI